MNDPDWSAIEREIEEALIGEHIDWWLWLQEIKRQFYGNIGESGRILDISIVRTTVALEAFTAALKVGLPEGWTLEEAAAFEEIENRWAESPRGVPSKRNKRYGYGL